MSTNNLAIHTKILRSLRYAHALFRDVMVVFVLLLAMNSWVVTIFRVDGHSMDPTLRNGQLLPVCLACYARHNPELGDIVVVQYEGAQSVRFVKRITGIPGDTVSLNGRSIVLGSDEYFVLGDNRDNSTDSRVFGAIKRDHILGRVWTRN